MPKYVMDENNNKTDIILSLLEYEKLISDIGTYQKKIQELEDLLDINLAGKALEMNEPPIDFKPENYIKNLSN